MPTRHQGNAQEQRALNTYIKLLRAVDSLAARLQPQFTEAGLTWSQFGVLEVLYHLGPMCQSELGTKLLKSGGNITLVVDNLEKRKLVRRERSSEDRRFITVYLTRTGEKLISTQFPHHVSSIVQEMSVLTANEQEELGRLCRKLGLQQINDAPRSDVKEGDGGKAKESKPKRTKKVEN
ncbi:MAG: MarR family transcriptional regulator [Abitibacteriaceae bacterium]|nr:MarR family transcriptional regulator [Abditibacteriaceae bacterium]MBV9865402.1 MarR family transcriptional regulator [Abditibacteriaceae bacterium]